MSPELKTDIPVVILEAADPSLSSQNLNEGMHNTVSLDFMGLGSGVDKNGIGFFQLKLNIKK